MAAYLDDVPFSGIIRIRDMMYGVKDPFRLDQGDVSFDAPDSVKAAMRQAIDDNRSHYLQQRRNIFYTGIRDHAAGVLSGDPPRGAFYAFLRIDPRWQTGAPVPDRSISWAMAEHLIAAGRIGCVPGVDFGANGEGYIRFCFARDRGELTGALEAMQRLFAAPRD
jgi:(5-formylfuran-3-yl)methyl phosphate transaminase